MCDQSVTEKTFVAVFIKSLPSFVLTGVDIYTLQQLEDVYAVHDRIYRSLSTRLSRQTSIGNNNNINIHNNARTFDRRRKYRDKNYGTNRDTNSSDNNTYSDQWYRQATCFHCGVIGHPVYLCPAGKQGEKQTPAGAQAWAKYVSLNPPPQGQVAEYDYNKFVKAQERTADRRKKRLVSIAELNKRGEGAQGADINNDNNELCIDKVNIANNNNNIESSELKAVKQELIEMIDNTSDIAYSLYCKAAVNDIPVKPVLIDQGCTHNCASEYIYNKLNNIKPITKIPLNNTYMTSSSGHRVPVPFAFIANISLDSSRVYRVAFYVIQSSEYSKNLSHDIIIGRQGLVQCGYYIMNLQKGTLSNYLTHHIIYGVSRKREASSVGCDNNIIVSIPDSVATATATGDELPER